MPTTPTPPKPGEHGPNSADSADAQRARGRGRPTILTPEVEAKLLGAIQDGGMSLRTACAFVGISEDTLARRRKVDPSLAERVERAKEMFKACMVTLVTKAAPVHWNAAAWLLERKFPEEFGRQRLEITGAGGGPVSIEADMQVAAAIRADPAALRKISEGVALAIAARKTS